MRCIVPMMLAALGLLVLSNSSSAQDDPLPGILVEYAPHHGPTLRRIEYELGTQLASGLPAAVPHRFPLTITWKGWWLPDGRGPHRWLISGTGSAKLELGGLAAHCVELNESASQGIPFDVARADWTEFRLQVTFADHQGSVRIAWEGPSFPPEPFPLHRLGHDPDDLASRTTLAEQRVSELRCAACHQQLPQPSHHRPTPNLRKRVAQTDANWIRQRIVNHLESIPNHDESPSHTSTLQFPIESPELDDLVAYLASQATTNSLPVPQPHIEPESAAAGETLLNTIGCTACHNLHSDSRLESTLGFGLQHVAARRTRDFLDQWLANPIEVDPHASMPRVELSATERANILAFFAASTSKRPQTRPIEDALAIQRGAQSYRQWKCDQCHSTTPTTPPLARPIDLQAGCLADDPSSETPFTPKLKIANHELEAIREYLDNLPTTSSLDFDSPLPRGTTADLLSDQHCFRCHDRGRRDLAAKTRERALPSLTLDDRARWRAPALDAVGDKFKREALQTILTSGSQRRDWLTLRMPQHALHGSPAIDESKTIERVLDWLQAVDRLETSLIPEPVVVSDHDTKTHGARLVSSAGFGCISCHAAGDYRPLQAPAHATGPPLDRLDQRLERAWFDRWVRTPARIVPNMEMPSFRLPVHGVLENQIDRQLATVWQSLSRDDFRVANLEPERVLGHTGHSSAPAIVVTDIVRLEQQAWIAPWVAGLSNRHNILFDGSTGSLAAWWFGDVARQFTEGKSWYWQPGGFMLATQETNHTPSEWQLEHQGQIIAPNPQGQFLSEVEGWKLHADSVTLERSIQFSHDNLNWKLQVQESFTPLVINPSENHIADSTFLTTSGFRRAITISGTPLPTLLFSLDGIASTPHHWVQESDTQWSLASQSQCRVRLVETSVPHTNTPDHTGMRFAPTPDAETITLVLEYLCDLPAEITPLPPHDLLAGTTSPSTPQVDTVPGFEATIIADGTPWMPTGLAWSPQGDLFVTSLNGSLWRVPKSTSEPFARPEPFADGLATPFGVHATQRYIDVIHKSGLMRLWDHNHDGQADQIRTLARGWGHTADYHDWAVGLPQDPQGNYWIALSCRQDERDHPAAALRGTLLRLTPQDPSQETTHYHIETMADGVRFPVGIAIRRDGQIYFTDNQGNYNPFNELNVFRPQAHYGFLNAWQAHSGPAPPETPPTVAIPHPWTRSVNGLAVLELPSSSTFPEGFGPWSGHLVACEYDTQRLVRMSLETIDGTQQGAVYPFSTGHADSQAQLLGPLTIAVSPTGELLVGAIRDSGWGGGDNIGRLLRLRFNPSLVPPGIAEVKATATGFRIHFSQPIDPQRTADSQNWTIRSYRRISTPDYGGPDRDTRSETLRHIHVAADRMSAEIVCQESLRPGFVYRIETSDLAETSSGNFFPAEAHYTLHAVPK